MNTDNINRQLGFSLIETLVALVILGTTFSIVWGWFGSAAISTSKIENAMAMPMVFDELTDHLDTVELQFIQNGSINVADYDVEWIASVDRQSNKEFYRKQPAWIVTLFDIHAEIRRNGQLVDEIHFKHVGQWKDPNYVSPVQAFP